MQFGEDLAENLYDLMPWLKIVTTMREPISRSISKYVMFREKFGKGCFVDNPIVYCLKRDKERFYGNPKKSYYSRPLTAWLDHFPKEQIKLIQYEDLIGDAMKTELHSVKEFLGLDPDKLGDTLDPSNQNCRHCRISPEGWSMKERDYRLLIDRVKPDVDECVYTGLYDDMLPYACPNTMHVHYVVVVVAVVHIMLLSLSPSSCCCGHCF